MKTPKTKSTPKKLVREIYGGERYEYYPLGKYVVAAPGICGGRPTFKYTRMEAAFVLDLLASGWSIEEVTREYKASRLSASAVQEAIKLAREALVQSSPVLRLAA
jgi:uncharacterized protein (DUF433 family)